MVSIFLGLILAMFSLAVTARKSLSTLVDDCKFTIDKRTYDLCPMFNRSKSSYEWRTAIESQTPPTVTKVVYRIALKGALKRNETLPDEDQCPKDTWVCMTSFNRRPKHKSEAPRIIQLVPVAGNLRNDTNHSAKSSTVNLTAQHGRGRNGADILEVYLHGGSYVGKRQKARIQFLCDHDVREPSGPSFAWSWNGTHAFTWSTRYACGKSVAVPSPAPDDGDDESDPPPQDDDDESDPPVNDENDLLGFLPVQKQFTFIILTASGVLMTAYLMYLPPYRLRRWVRAHLVKSQKPQLPFRVAEGLLVRWAEEDLGIQGEEDFMVNGREDYYNLDEEIPLKPSPGQLSSRDMNYGSTGK